MRVERSGLCCIDDCFWIRNFVWFWFDFQKSQIWSKMEENEKWKKKVTSFCLFSREYRSFVLYWIYNYIVFICGSIARGISVERDGGCCSIFKFKVKLDYMFNEEETSSENMIHEDVIALFGIMKYIDMTYRRTRDVITRRLLKQTIRWSPILSG